MGSAAVQSTIWGPRASDWADVQEGTVVPLYESVLDALNVRAPMAVLDVGCGSGLFCQLAAERGASLSGIDATGMLLDIAKRRVQADFRQCDMEQLPFPSRTFHIVTGFHAFEHAQVPLNALCEARRVARPGGAVVAAVWGRPDQVQAADYLDAIAALLPVPRSGVRTPGGAGASFALSEADDLPDLARDAGLEPIRFTEVDCVWRYADEHTALRGLLSAGPAVRAIQASGERAVRQAVLKAIAPYRLPNGGYELRNTCRYVITKA